MAVPQLSFLCRGICCKDLGSNGLNSKHSLEEQLLHLAFTTSAVVPVRIGKTRVAANTTARWVVSNSDSMPLAMKRPQHIYLDRPGKTGTSLADSLFCNAQVVLKTILNHGSCDCPTVVILVQLYLLQRSGPKWDKFPPSNRVVHPIL